MGQLVGPVTVATKDGEIKVHLTLELNINLNTSDLNINVNAATVDDKPEAEKTNWVIPDFSSNKEKIPFGRKD